MEDPPSVNATQLLLDHRVLYFIPVSIEHHLFRLIEPPSIKTGINGLESKKAGE